MNSKFLKMLTAVVPVVALMAVATMAKAQNGANCKNTGPGVGTVDIATGACDGNGGVKIDIVPSDQPFSITITGTGCAVGSTVTVTLSGNWGGQSNTGVVDESGNVTVGGFVANTTVCNTTPIKYTCSDSSDHCAVGDNNVCDGASSKLVHLRAVNADGSQRTDCGGTKAFSIHCNDVSTCAPPGATCEVVKFTDADTNPNCTAQNAVGNVAYTYSPDSGTCFTVSAPTTVNVTGTDDDGNIAHCNFTVSFTTTDPNCKPEECTLGAPDISGNQPVCQGNTVTLKASAPGGQGTVTYSWTGPAGYTATGDSITVGTAGDYTVTATDTATLCQTQRTVKVVVNPNPICSFTYPALGTVCVGTQNILTYVWSTGATTPCITVGPGSYWVTITDNNGCSNTCNVSICNNTPGGRTMGYWANQGNSSISSLDIAYLATLHLWNGNGTGFVPTTQKSISNFLQAASATNMANMLSAQMIATALDVRHGITANNVYVDGGNAVCAEITYANSLLANPVVYKTVSYNGGNTVASTPLRAEQERVKNIFDKINGMNGGFPGQCNPTLTYGACP